MLERAAHGSTVSVEHDEKVILVIDISRHPKRGLECSRILLRDLLVGVFILKHCNPVGSLPMVR